jgi:RNA polymerase sigma factor for flagellar operon FliA
MRIEPINREKVTSLWQTYGGNPQEATRDALIQTYHGYARIMAGHYYRQRTCDDIPFEEYLQLAHIGLIEAIDRFDPTRGVLFETFAGKRIRGVIVDGIANLSEVQQQLAERRRRLHERTASLAQAAPSVPTDDTELLFAQLADVAVGLAIGFAMDAGADSTDGGSGDTTYASVEIRQLRELVLDAVRALPDRVRTVITLHYLQRQSFSEISDELGLTAGRISQLHRDGIEQLRLRLKRQARLDLHC